MWLVHFQNIALQHGVVCIALHLDAVVRHDVAVVFDVLTHLVHGRVFKPWFEFGQHLIDGQLRGRIAIAVCERDVAGFAGFDGETQTHNLSAHGVDRGGFRVKRHQLGGL